MLHGLRHLLTPGDPGYAALKIGAVAGVAGLQIAMRRRAKHRDAPVGDAAPGPDHHATAPPRRPHPRSKKKRRRR